MWTFQFPWFFYEKRKRREEREERKKSGPYIYISIGTSFEKVARAAINILLQSTGYRFFIVQLKFSPKA